MVEKVNEVVRTASADLKDQYLDGELTEERYVSAMSKLTAEEEIASDVEGMKVEKYEELQEKFINDEISEAEMEAEMDRLFESGDDFLDAEPVEQETPDMTSEATFRLKEVGQIVAFVGIAGLAIFLFLITKGMALLPMIVTGIIALLAYSRFNGKI